MLQFLTQWFTANLRRQLVIGIVLVVATAMTLFVWDLTQRQQRIMLEQQSEQALALAQSIASSSAVWVASRDVSGLQEIVDGLKKYPDLQHAIVLNNSGQVLAHSDLSRRGFYLSDLPDKQQVVVLTQNKSMIDIAHPIIISGTHIGWVRIALGHKVIEAKLTKITRNGVFYTLIAVLLTFILAMLAARRLTSRLYAIASVVDAVQEGKRDLRTDVSGTDEAAQLSRQFNDMLDTLARRENEIIESHHALVQSESRLHQIMDVTGEGIWDWDLQTDQISHNLSWCNILGLDKSSLSHSMEYFSRLLHKDDLETVMARVQSCLHGNGGYSSIHRMIRQDGSTIWVQDRGEVTERDSDGKPLRMLGSIADITQRKLAENKLIDINDKLEERVERRTAEMKAARDEAELASAAKSEFLSRMSHELRTPLNAILGFAQVLTSDTSEKLTPIQSESVEEILTAGEHLLELVNEVLDLSRIETGQIDLTIETVNTVNLIKTSLAQLRPLADQNNISMRFDAVDDAAVLADQLRLNEVMINLISNAIKYNKPAGYITVSCKISKKNQLRISVEDSGRGISDNDMSRLFRPFERSESAYDAIEGTGIGLALVKKLLEAMNSEIHVKSTYGEGSTFWFDLPVSAETTDDNSSATVRTASEGDALKKVLYIEDSIANMSLMRNIFSMHGGIELIEARTAEDGLSSAFKQPPDLILLDINLPGMDGFEALEQLKKNPLTAGVPVIAVTANAMLTDVERGSYAGFAEYITKPLDIKHLLTLINNYLNII
ncbi:MAG: ATP-binding protein [Gammaproteobacteria bacterium]|nr:ATP-binding protein [Gammaproteobacteria bacterium]